MIKRKKKKKKRRMGDCWAEEIQIYIYIYIERFQEGFAQVTLKEGFGFDFDFGFGLI